MLTRVGPVDVRRGAIGATGINSSRNSLGSSIGVWREVATVMGSPFVGGAAEFVPVSGADWPHPRPWHQGANGTGEVNWAISY